MMNKQKVKNDKQYLIAMNDKKYYVFNKEHVDFNDSERLSKGSIDVEIDEAIKELGSDFMVIESNSVNPNEGKLVGVYVSNRLLNYREITPQILGGLSNKVANLSKNKLEGLAEGYMFRALTPKEYKMKNYRRW